MRTLNRWTRGLVALAGAVALAGGIAACGDVASPRGAASAASTRSTGPVPPSANPALLGISTLVGADTTTQTLTVDPSTPTVLRYANGDAIVIPAFAICDVGTSGYGAEFWNQPCQPQTTTLTITVKYFTNAVTGLPSMEFEPKMRFRPTDAGVTTIYFRQADQSLINKLILYCPGDVRTADPATGCVDEGLTDPDLATHQDLTSGYLYRQLKHFSGYLVAVGFTSDTTAGVLP